jgi:hypothetical protein
LADGTTRQVTKTPAAASIDSVIMAELRDSIETRVPYSGAITVMGASYENPRDPQPDEPGVVRIAGDRPTAQAAGR